MAAIFECGWTCQTQFYKGTTQGPFHQTLKTDK